jgi:hypothetical protein
VDGRVESSDVVRMRTTSLDSLRILIFNGLTARRLYKSFGVKGLTGFVIVVESVYTAVRTDSFYKTDYVWSLKG